MDKLYVTYSILRWKQAVSKKDRGSIVQYQLLIDLRKDTNAASKHLQ